MAGEELWRVGIEVMKAIHHKQFPEKQFGRHLDLLLTLGAAFALHSENRTVNSSRLSVYLEMPRETARRRLGLLEECGLLARAVEGGCVPTAKANALNAHAQQMFLRRLRK